jgi:hypothetical protein
MKRVQHPVPERQFSLELVSSQNQSITVYNSRSKIVVMKVETATHAAPLCKILVRGQIPTWLLSSILFSTQALCQESLILKQKRFVASSSLVSS